MQRGVLLKWSGSKLCKASDINTLSIYDSRINDTGKLGWAEVTDAHW